MIIRIALIAAIAVCSANLFANDHGGAHIVAGSAYIAWDDGGWVGEWQHIFAVTESPNGEPRGHVRERYYDSFGDLVIDTEFVTEVDCLEIDGETREAWIGGEVVSVTEGPDSTLGELFPPLGTKVVYYADDNDGSIPRTDNPDLHGNIFIGWEWGVPPWLTCHDRVGPWVADPSSRGKIIVR